MRSPSNPFGRSFALPAVNKRAADSPTILPMAKIAPVIMPGIALGIRMVLIKCHFPLPRPMAPFRYESGTDFSASYVFRVIKGNTMIMSVNEPVRIE